MLCCKIFASVYLWLILTQQTIHFSTPILDTAERTERFLLFQFDGPNLLHAARGIILTELLSVLLLSSSAFPRPFPVNFHGLRKAVYAASRQPA